MTSMHTSPALASPPRPSGWQTRAPSLVLALGIIYTVYLLSQVQAGVFYSGDGGLKTLMVKQFAAGRFGDALALPAEPWVRQLWDEGLYPFGPPFVYDLPRGRVVAFPLLFLVLTAPFYRIFGPAGLYVIPVASLWLLWFRFTGATRRLALPPSVAAAALAGLIFSTPLTLYGAMFWEHTLGALLVFCGVEYLLTRTPTRDPAHVAISWGVLAGLAVWIRSESICLIAAMAVVAIMAVVRRHRKDAGWFVLGLILNVAALLIINSVLYGRPFGVHSFQIIGQAVESVGEAGYRPMLVALVFHAPVTAFAVLGFLIGGRRLAEAAGRLRAGPLVVISVLFLALVPWVAPNLGGKQWGPRYLLVLMPLLALLAGMLLLALLQTPRKAVRHCWLILFAVSVAAGGYLNTCLGSAHLRADYRLRIKPALDFLREDSCPLVAVTQQWMAQELAAAFEVKAFFWTRDSREIGKLARRAHQEGHSRFLLITAPQDRPPSRIASHRADSPLAGVAITLLGRYGEYAIYTVEAIVR